MKRIFFLLTMFSLLCLTVFGQDTAAQDSVIVGEPGGVLPDTLMGWLVIAVAVYEVLVRFIPTLKDISILSWVMKIINAVIPNKAAPAAPEEAVTAKQTFKATITPDKPGTGSRANCT